MTFQEKLEYLQDNHFKEWVAERQRVENDISKANSLVCV